MLLVGLPRPSLKAFAPFAPRVACTTASRTAMLRSLQGGSAACVLCFLKLESTWQFKQTTPRVLDPRLPGKKKDWPLPTLQSRWWPGAPCHSKRFPFLCSRVVPVYGIDSGREKLCRGKNMFLTWLLLRQTTTGSWRIFPSCVQANCATCPQGRTTWTRICSWGEMPGVEKPPRRKIANAD